MYKPASNKRKIDMFEAIYDTVGDYEMNFTLCGPLSVFLYISGKSINICNEGESHRILIIKSIKNV